MKKPVNLVLGLIAATLCLWSGWYLLLRGAAPGKTATVRLENQVLMTIDLQARAGQTLSLEEWGLPVYFQVEKGRVRFADSDCPDKICINTGWLSESGQTAVCMPNRVTLTID